MRQQTFNGERRDSKSFLVVDEDCGIPTSVVESYREGNESGSVGQYDPRSLLLSMSEYDKPQAPAYSVQYDYNAATRPEPGQDYTGFAAPPPFSGQYVGAQAQVPSGLPQSTAALGLPHSAQPYDTHDQPFYGQQQPQFSDYIDTSPRRAPEIISFTPNEGPAGTKVTVYFQSPYDLDHPQITAFIMFGHKRCESVLHKSQIQGSMYQYALSADSPPQINTNSPLQIPLQLVLDSTSVTWDSPSLEFGSFTYLEPPVYYASTSPDVAPARKRKLSLEASPRHSPIKKAVPSGSANQGQTYLPTGTPTSPFRRPSASEAYSHTRRFSGNDYQQAYPGAVNQQYYGPGPGHTTPSMRTTASPSWNYNPGYQSANRSPSTASVSVSGKNAQLLPSPASSNPPLIRTSTLQTSPTTPSTATSTTGFNPYAIYAANSKAMLKIEGDLNTMADKWSGGEWECKRRLVQFRRSQSGSVISATFEAVTPEERIPNSICVSCIWWEEKQECYVTSVDTISLLESLVAVRFTVEEKNRIRRNLEGFRPATVSKVKADSEEFFKLIMGFPNPKPRNIEKDVKVFPWRILATALKKIIGKYASHPGAHDASCTRLLVAANIWPQSASYSSTAGALHAPAGASYSTTGRAADVGAGIEQHYQRAAASPRSTSSSVTSHTLGHAAAYAPMPMPMSMPMPMMGAHVYPHAANAAMLPTGLGLGPSAGPADLRLHVPGAAAGQATTALASAWNSAASHYNAATTPGLASAGSGRGSGHGSASGSGGGGGAGSAGGGGSARESWDFSGYNLSGGSPPATGLPGAAQAYQYNAHAQRFPALGHATGLAGEARFVALHDYEEPSQQTSTS